VSEKDGQEGQQCPECGETMDRKEGKGVTRCSGELRHSTVVKDFCECGIRVRVRKEIGEPL